MAQTRRKPAARPRPKSPARVKRRRRRNRTRNDVELIGLGLLAAGVFLACVVWLGLNGGPVPHAVRSAIGWGGYLTPLLFCPLGALVLTRSRVLAVAPFRFGLALSLLGLMLALGSGQGGFVGRQLESLVGRGVGSTGSTILGVLATLVGATFLTGASIGALIQRSGRGRAVTVSSRVRGERRPRPRVAVPLEPSFDSDTYSMPRQEAPVDAVHDYPDLVTPSFPASRPLGPLVLSVEPDEETPAVAGVRGGRARGRHGLPAPRPRALLRRL